MRDDPTTQQPTDLRRRERLHLQEAEAARRKCTLVGARDGSRGEHHAQPRMRRDHLVDPLQHALDLRRRLVKAVEKQQQRAVCESLFQTHDTTRRQLLVLAQVLPQQARAPLARSLHNRTERDERNLQR